MKYSNLVNLYLSSKYNFYKNASIRMWRVNDGMVDDDSIEFQISFDYKKTENSEWKYKVLEVNLLDILDTICKSINSVKTDLFITNYK